MSIREKLLNIQSRIKEPAEGFKDYGDILKAARPALKNNNLALVLKDEVEQIGEHNYIRATAVIFDLDGDETLINSAYAREAEIRGSGTDAPKITGTASAYARKNALMGLFCLADKEPAPKKASKDQIEHVKNLVKDITAMLEYYEAKTIEDLTEAQANEVIRNFSKGDKKK